MNPYLAYALTRMQARLARRPDSAARARLVAIEDFGHFLQSAGAAGLGGWLEHLGPGSDTHAIELALRLKYRARLDELGRWLPERWQALMDWLARAIDLPVLDRLRSGAPPPSWLQRDPELAPLLGNHVDERVDERGQAVPDLLDGRIPSCPNDDDGLDACWLRGARKRLPGDPRKAAGDELLLPHVRPEPGRSDDRRYERSFRRAAQPAERVLAFAVLMRRDYEFLRGQLCARRLRAEGRS